MRVEVVHGVQRMKSAFLIGLAVLLAACGGESDAPKLPEQPVNSDPTLAPATWKIPKALAVGKPLRTFETPGGVLVHVLSEGKGKPAAKGRAMTIRYAAYLVAGHLVDRAAIPGFVPGNRRWITGLSEGMEGARSREKRRLLIPAGLTKGNLRHGKASPGGNLIIEAEWVQLERTDLRVGIGAEAKVGSKITVHYLGRLEDGTVFDSSYERNEPFSATLKKGRLIDGWVLGIPGMKVGGTRTLWVPWHLGYDDQNKDTIPPYSDLTFVVELLVVE